MRPPMGMNPGSHAMLNQVARNDPQVANALQVGLYGSDSGPMMTNKLFIAFDINAAEWNPRG